VAVLALITICSGGSVEDPPGIPPRIRSLPDNTAGKTVTGRVLNNVLGDPIPGATVRIVQDSQEYIEDTATLDRTRPTAVTDSNGLFRLENVRPGPRNVVVVTHPDFASRIRWNCYVFRNRDTALRDIRLQRGITVRGRVRGESGAPIKGARIRVLGSSEEAARLARLARLVETVWPVETTGEDGDFRIKHVMSGEYDVDIECKGFQTTAFRKVKCDLIQMPLKFVLKPGLTLEGIVQDRLGESISGARITLSRPDNPGAAGEPTPTVAAGSDGRFSVQDLPSVTHDLEVSAPGFQTAVAKNVLPGAPVFTVELEFCASVEGTVTDAISGESLDAFTVTVLEPARDGEGKVRMRRRFQEASGGGFRLDGLESGPCRVEVRAPGRAYCLSPLLELKAGETIEDLSFPLEKGVSLEGMAVVERTMTPVEGARVVAVALIPSGRAVDRIPPVKKKEAKGSEGRSDGNGASELKRISSHVAARARTDANGLFALDHLTPGRYEVRFAGESFLVKRLCEVEVTDTRSVILVEVRRGGAVQGRTLGATGGPIPGAQVVLTAAKGSLKRWTFSDDEGEFGFRGLEPGQYSSRSVEHRLRVEGTLCEEPRFIEVRSGLVNRCDLVAQERSDLIGKVRWMDAPVAGIHGVLTRTGEGKDRRLASWHVWSDDGGSFRFTGLPPGRYVFSAYTREGVQVAARKVDVISRSIVHEDINLPGSKVIGQVKTLVTGRPLAGVELRLFPEVSKEKSRRVPFLLLAGGTESGAGGDFEFPHVPPGRYCLEAWKAGYMWIVVSGIEVKEYGTAGPVQICLDGGGVVQGVLRNGRTGRPDLEAFVRLLDDSGNPVPGLTGLVLARRGKFRIQGMKPGIYHLRFLKPGYKEVLRRIEVKEGVNAVVRVELE